MVRVFDEIVTPRLRLIPFDGETACAVLDGDLTGVSAVAGWPHPGTLNGLKHAVERDESPGWMITVDGHVIGDCGTHGGADADGMVEIGYGLAESFRRQGFGTEAVAGLTDWLFTQPDTRTVRACTLTENIASRRVLESNGFLLKKYDADGLAIYERRATREDANPEPVDHRRDATDAESATGPVVGRLSRRSERDPGRVE